MLAKTPDVVCNGFLLSLPFPGLVPHRLGNVWLALHAIAPPLQSDACFTSCQRARSAGADQAALPCVY
jgi:hypothetical protein